MGLYRFQMIRGKRPAGDPLPEGIRQDTRKHTRHVLRPTAEMVDRYLADPTAAAFATFRRDYLAELERRFREERTPFDELAGLAGSGDVHLGCSCPSAANPDVQRCHTVQALRFMARKYRKLRVVLPE